MSKLSITRFFLPSILLLSILNLSLLLFQTMRTSLPMTKYMDELRVEELLVKQVIKTLSEMSVMEREEIKVLNEEIKLLEEKKKTKGYLSTLDQKKLEQKKEQVKRLLEALQKVRQEAFNKMITSKMEKVKQIKSHLAEKNGYIIHATGGVLKTTVPKKDDVTDLVIAELDVEKNQATKK